MPGLRLTESLLDVSDDDDDDGLISWLQGRGSNHL